MVKLLNKLNRAESGQALVVVLVLLAVGSLAVVPALNLASVSLNYHRTVDQNTKENYAAGAGVEYALCKLVNEHGTLPLNHSFNINGNIVNVTAEYVSDDTFKITSVVTEGSENGTSVESYARIASYIYYDGDTLIECASYINDNIYINGDLELDTSSTIEGGVYVVGDAYIDHTCVIDGDLYVLGNIIFEHASSTVTGNIYADGDVYADHGILVEGDVYATGSIFLDHNSVIEGDAYAGVSIDIASGAAEVVGTSTEGYTGPWPSPPAWVMGDIEVFSWQIDK